MLIDHAHEKIGDNDGVQAFEAKLHDHLLTQGQQFGEHVIWVQAGAPIGGSTRSRHEGENRVHQIEVG